MTHQTKKFKMMLLAPSEAVAKQWRKDWPGVAVFVQKPLPQIERKW